MIPSIKNLDSPFTLGILGGGQLAKMLAAAGYRMGINIAIIETYANTPAGDMTKLEFPNGWENEEELEKFAVSCDLATLENEFIDPVILDKVQKYVEVYPSPETMRMVQDKYIQKCTFRDAGLPVPVFEELSDLEAARKFGGEYGYPFVIKARKYGYDGYGNATVFNEEEVSSAWEKFNNEKIKRPLMAERFVDFQKELAVIVAINKSGEKAVYPCVETIQYRHICHEVIAPAEISDELQKKAQEIALASVRSINGVGVFGVELFLTKDGDILINEIAPRPHNSGHYTIEGCYTSQFENCIRAVCNLPLGSPKLVKPAAAMVNLLGERKGNGVPRNVVPILRHDSVWLHLYNKKQSRPGRKMGHITALGESQENAIKRARSAAAALVW